MQCNLEFVYQLSIWSKTEEKTENRVRVGRSQDLPDASSPAFNRASPDCSTYLLALFVNACVQIGVQCAAVLHMYRYPSL
jgi:hypothetical protein